MEIFMFDINNDEILTRITKYNLMSSGKSILIDVHEAITGKLAAKFVAVPNLVMVIANPKYQGAGETEEEALKDCFEKIRNVPVNELFPQNKQQD